jgi:hypothetical protein
MRENRRPDGVNVRTLLDTVNARKVAEGVRALDLGLSPATAVLATPRRFFAGTGRFRGSLTVAEPNAPRVAPYL